MILAVNTSSNALNQLAAGLTEAGLLSRYVRPYANMGRQWEKQISRLPGLGTFYARSFGRRRMPHPLGADHIREAGMVLDFAMAAHQRLMSRLPGCEPVRKALIYALANAVARTAMRTLGNEKAVVASWGCAEPVFRRMKAQGGLCVLNYPLAHHRFTRRYLQEEAELQPTFADTLNSHNRPAWLEQRFDTEIELADRILVGSSFVHDSFIAEGVPAEKLVVIPYGADTRLFEPAEQKALDGNGLRLLFVGQISQRKGIFYLLEAMRRLGDRGPALTMVGQIQGDGRALAPYRHLFRHVPHVPHTELREIYRQADVCVFPTLVEGLSLVVLEAMASGLPVITTPNGQGDIVRNGADGFLVPPRDVNAIVDRLERLRADPALRIEMGRSARKRAQEFTWEAYKKTAVSLFRSWLNGLERIPSNGLAGGA